MIPAIAFPEPIPFLEATGDGATKRVQAANRAGQETLTDRLRMERDAVTQVLGRMQQLKQALQQRLIGGTGSLTDFRRFDLQARLAEVDRLIADATADLANLAKQTYQGMAQSGISHATEPLKAAKLNILQATPGIDAHLVQASFGNTVDLLTVPMQQFATDVKVSLRRVTLSGDNRMDEIKRLQDKIGGAGFGGAQYKAERIIRTEAGRVFNEATYNRLVALSKDFPFIGKGWRASKDKRTRLGHVQAAQTYTRGQGIPVASLFSVNVHDERGKVPKLKGTVTMRFPLDPQASPVGQLAASATIMCRCNSFVDFNMAQFSQFTAASVQTALSGLKPPTPGPPAPKLPAVKTPKMVKPKVKKPDVRVPKKADVLPTPEPVKPKIAGPAGTPVSKAMALAGNKAHQAVLAEAMKALDSVHGASGMASIPLKATGAKSRKYGSYSYGWGRAGDIKITGSGMKGSPYITTWHEVGHYLDHTLVGYSPGNFFSEVTVLPNAEVKAALDDWKKAIRESKAYQTLVDWRLGRPGTPTGVHIKHLKYLLSTKEAWARSYSQYIAEKSGHAAGIAEAKNMAGTTGPVAAGTPFNSNQMGTTPAPNTWDYPKQWKPEDFKPIMAAFDRLMGALGWRNDGK